MTTLHLAVVHTTVMNSKLVPMFLFATFAPGEVERITGVSTTLLRDWRRRGIIRPGLDKGDDGAFSLKAFYINDALFTFAVDDPAAWRSPTDHLRWLARPRDRTRRPCRFAYIDRAGDVAQTEDPSQVFADAGRMVVTLIDLGAIAAHVRDTAGKPLAQAGPNEIVPA